MASTSCRDEEMTSQRQKITVSQGHRVRQRCSLITPSAAYPVGRTCFPNPHPPQRVCERLPVLWTWGWEVRGQWSSSVSWRGSPGAGTGIRHHVPSLEEPGSDCWEPNGEARLSGCKGGGHHPHGSWVWNHEQNGTSSSS